MYSKKTGLVLGFHGCDRSTAEYVVNGGKLTGSKNDYDWLGNGIYFWEADPIRALEWAEELSLKPKSSIAQPAVVGAVIDMGNCLDLTTRGSINLLKIGYTALVQTCDVHEQPVPVNRNVNGNNDLLLRKLDCAVIEMLHRKIASNPDIGLLPFDSVKGMFTEGGPAYDGSGFMSKTHTQICVINPNCIKGYFLPRDMDPGYPIP